MFRLSFYFFAVLLTILVSFVSAGTTAEGLAWLAEKKKEPGVVALESGLMYKEIKAGDGKTPTVDSPCECHYAGRLIDGTEFDSSYKRGAVRLDKSLRLSPVFFEILLDFADHPLVLNSLYYLQPTTFAPNQVIKVCVS